MKRMTILITLPLLALLPGQGCQQAPSIISEDRREANAWLANWYQDAAIQNAIVEQHTLYPYHFYDNGAALNDLGERDLRVLAEHYTQSPGQVNVRRGRASDELYQARLERVKQALTEAGVDVQRVQLADRPAGGEGMSSERVLAIMAAERVETAEPSNSYYAPTEGVQFTGAAEGEVTGGTTR